MDINENDIPAKETFKSESSWIQSKNEHTGRKKSSCSKKSKRKKSIISLGRIYVAFFSIMETYEKQASVMESPSGYVSKTGEQV